MCFVRLNDLHLNYIYLFLIIKSILLPSSDDHVTQNRVASTYPDWRKPHRMRRTRTLVGKDFDFFLPKLILRFNVYTLYIYIFPSHDIVATYDLGLKLDKHNCMSLLILNS